MEMFLHHGATLFLYGTSYYLNRVECGLIIMFLHDWADIPTAAVRCWTETKYTNIAVASAVSMAVVWLYSRLFIFPQIIYQIMHVEVYEGQFPIVLQFCGFMLIALQVLHFYWFYVLYLSFAKYFKKGQIDDLQKKVVDKKKK